MQNKPNFPHFSTKNEDFAKKQSQFKPNSNPILAQKSGWQSQFKPNFKKALSLLSASQLSTAYKSSIKLLSCKHFYYCAIQMNLVILERAFPAPIFLLNVLTQETGAGHGRYTNEKK
jgi:hypothetical protein